MALVKLNFTDDEKYKLSNLAMEVEIHEKRKYEINKSVVAIGNLLDFASSSRNPMVMRALRQFALVMCPDTAHFLRILSVDVNKIQARNFQLLDENDRATIARNTRNLQATPLKKKGTIARMFQTMIQRKIG